MGIGKLSTAMGQNSKDSSIYRTMQLACTISLHVCWEAKLTTSTATQAYQQHRSQSQTLWKLLAKIQNV